MIRKQTIKTRKYLGKNHDENEVDNNIQEVDNEDKEVSWKEP